MCHITTQVICTVVPEQRIEAVPNIIKTGNMLEKIVSHIGPLGPRDRHTRSRRKKIIRPR